MRLASFIIAPAAAAVLLTGGSEKRTRTAHAHTLPHQVQPSPMDTGTKATLLERQERSFQVFDATTANGVIGPLYGEVPDEAADNLFHIVLDRKPAPDEAAWLEYDLFGLADHDAVPRSIGHRTSSGGGPVVASANWSHQRERIASAQLSQGRNSVWFHAARSGQDRYEVRNVRIVLGPDAEQQEVVVTNARLRDRCGSVYVKGVLAGKASKATRVSAHGQALRVQEGAFEGVVSVGSDVQDLLIEATSPEGHVSRHRVTLTEDDASEPIDLAPSPMQVDSWMEPERGGTIALQEAVLSVPPFALQRGDRIAAIALPATELPPTGQDLVNVCRDGSGFRFLPDGTTFSSPVGLTLPFDTTRLPAGYGPEDVRTFYFDEDQRRWLAVPKDSVQPDRDRVHSRTTHFSDYINGIIQVPESPETMGYTPTSIKDYKAGDVSAGITPLPPPAASNTGAATTRFLLKLPQGRQGMQPELAIQYNSEGGNGWMGLGWNLSTPSITIETRWGVPRYDLDKETETYLLDGEMLSPVTHRTEWVNRNTTGDKTFHPRVEGSFRRILRKENRPEDYWWEVTEKDGTRKLYGGDGDNVEENAVLRTGTSTNDPIAKWMLHKVIDSNGNTITYTYETVVHEGTDGSPNEGRQIYPKRIRYTGRQGGDAGAYSVEFDFDTTGRADKQINCRLGFKEVTANLLQRVDVKYSGEMVRSYRLMYKEGAFKKTLLDSIVEYDANGERFYGYGMEYHDDVRDGENYEPYQDESWSGGMDDDGLTYDGNNPFVDTSDRSASLLSGGLTSNWSLGGSANIGPPGNTNSQKYSIGGSFGYSRSKGSSIVTLTDIDGDNLPDKIYRSNDGLFYRPNQSGASTFGFGDPIPLLGAGSHFSQTRTRSVNYGFEIHANPAFYAKNRTKSTTRTTTYLLDRNGDGLLDINRNGLVYFNYRDADGHTQFTTDIGLTTNPIESGAPVSQQAIDQAEIDELLAQSPLLDVVRVWVAPYKGSIRIDAPITLQPDNSELAEEYEHEDGVRATIQVRESDTCSTVIPFGDPSTHLFDCGWVNSINVNKGDRVYFRLNSVVDGAFDLVSWDPEIRYLVVEEPDLDPDTIPAELSVDANGKPLYVYRSSTDLLLANDQGIAISDSGVIGFRGFFSKPVTSDDVDLLVVRSNEDGTPLDTALYQRFAWNATFIDSSISGEIAVDTSDILSFKITSNSNVEWDSLEWLPEAFYAHHVSLTDEQLFDDNGNPLIRFVPVVDKVAFNEVRSENNADYVETQIGRPYVPDSSATIDIHLYIARLENIAEGDSVTLTVKRLHQLVAKGTWFLPPGNINTSITLPDLSFDAMEGDPYYIDVTIPNRQLSDRVFTQVYANSSIPNHDGIEDLFGIHTVTDSVDRFFGPLQRRWGQFCYNFSAEGYSELDLIQEEHLHPDDEADFGNFNFESVNETDFENAEITIQSPLGAIFTPMHVVPDSGIWMGYDAHTFIGKGVMSTSRLGEDDVSFLFNTDFLDTAISAPVKVSKDSSNSRSWSVSYSVLGYSSNKMSGTTRSVIDAIDTDGDRYPDVVKEDSIQGTLPNGGYEAVLRPHPNGAHIGTSNSGESNWSANGSLPIPHFGVSGTMNAGKAASSLFNGGNPLKSLAKCVEAFGTSMGCVGLSVNLPSDPSESVDSVSVTWNDMNGDGLPDKVFKNGDVMLNIGRSFLPAETGWGFGLVRTGSTRDRGYGGGVNIDNGSFEFGVSASESTNGTVSGLMDVNGDGLLDEVIASDDEDDLWAISSVRFNTGNQFMEELVDWPTGAYGQFDLSRSIGESAKGSTTFGINLLFVRLVFNVNGSIGQGFSRSETQFADINGDGFPDFLHSVDDDSLNVLSSTIRRTNLLQEVRGPFGAKWSVDYEVAGNTYELPQSKWVMKSLTVWDGFLGDGPDTTYATFEYADGQYDRRERETYGFGTVRTHEWDTETSADEPYRTTVQTYDVSGYYTKGLPLVKTVQDGQGNKYTETANSYAVKLLNGNDAPANFNADDDSGTAFPALVRTEERFYEGEAEAGISKTVTFGYDAIGNVTEYKDLGFVGQDDEVVATIGYHYLEAAYIMSTPESISVSVAGELRRARTQEIDEATGNITAIHQTIDDQSVAHYEIYYTEEGNLDSIVRPSNYKGQRMHYGYTYDDAVKTYVTEVRDAYGYHSSSTYEYRFGQLLSTTDMNGEVTNYAIDDRGRVETVTGPYEVASGTPYTIKLEYVLRDNLPYSVVTHFDPEHPGGEGIRTVTFLDGQFRPLQVKKSAVISDGNGGEQARWIASGRVRFDAFGRTVESRYPTDTSYSAPAGAFVHHLDTVEPTRSTFDILDRERTVTLPDGISTTTTAYAVGSPNGSDSALWKRVTDALGNKKDSYTDVREREIARVDHGPMGEILTSFHYNGIGELLEVIDTENNTTSYTYDQLGRKLTYDHPDGGLTEFTYDPAGNLLTKNTANLREMFPDGGPIKYSYDFQRVDTINYPRNYMNQVVYVYGTNADTAFHRVGRVKLQLDGSGGQEFFYGPLGEVEKTIRTIVVSNTDIRTFVSEERYDTWNRIQVMKYPDGDSVSYTYNTAGKLKEVMSVKDNFSYPIVKDIGYDKFEQRVYLKHGNDVETRYAYEPDRRRLSTLKVDQPNGTRIMDNVYGYDQVNNVLSLVNNRAVPNDGQGGAMISTYAYDNLYRLTEATGTYTGSAREDAYTLTMAYDNLHNIRHKTQTHSSSFPTATLSNYDFAYAYDSAAPHTPSKVGYRAYDHDANGNLLDWEEDAPRMGTRHMAWDEENRLQAVNDAGYVSQYTYDAAGERVLKSHGGMEGVYINGAPVGLINHRDNYTIYVSPYLVHAEHGFTKHYFIEGQRVTSRTGNGHFITGPMPTPGLTAGRVDFYSRFNAMQQAATQQAATTGITPGMPTMGNYNGQPEVSGVPYNVNVGEYVAAPPPWPQPPVTPGAPGTPPTTPMPSVTNETVTAGYAFVTDANQAEMNRYFFHPDHLGSASYITGTDGTARQHVEYMAFGEVFVEEQNAADPLDYLFNGKELDRVTGLYYYGARYYDPVASMWASVDPMAEKYEGISPYAYALSNPIVNIDPDGRETKAAEEGQGESMSAQTKGITDALGAIGDEAELAENYLADSRTGQWRSTYLKAKEGMSKAGNAMRNLFPKLRSRGNQFLEAKENVMQRVKGWKAVGKAVGSVEGVISSFSGGFDLGNAILSGNKEQISTAGLNVGKVLGTAVVAENPLGASFLMGYGIGEFIDSQLGISGKVADALYNKFGPKPNP